MGISHKRFIKEYWSVDPYLVTSIFQSLQYLSCNRFLFILRYGQIDFYKSQSFFRYLSFHRFADCENLVVNDRLQRIHPFLNQMMQLCQSKYVPSRNIAVDETLLLYKG